MNQSMMDDFFGGLMMINQPNQPNPTNQPSMDHFPHRVPHPTHRGSRVCEARHMDASKSLVRWMWWSLLPPRLVVVVVVVVVVFRGLKVVGWMVLFIKP